MPLRTQNWYDANEARSWPLSDEASAIDNSGVRLPNRFIADLHLAFPLTAGRRAMLSAFTVTKTLVTAVIVAVDSADDPSPLTPLASFSLSKLRRIDPHRQYPLEALYPGVGGWIVLGSSATDGTATAEAYSGRFSHPRQAILLPSTARAYRPLPIPSTGVLGHSQQLTGLVRLRGGNDIEVVKECREIPAHPVPAGSPQCDPDIAVLRDVIVIRLKQRSQPGAVAEENLFDRYRGPCGGRPESGTCGDPPPIEALGTVLPDCCGNIDIVLNGCARLSQVVEKALVDQAGALIEVTTTCGVVIGCDLGLDDACVTPRRLPGPDGRLPNEFDDLCVSLSEVSVSLPPEEPEVSLSFSASDEEQSLAADPELPHCDDFQFNDPDLVVVSGAWEYSPGTPGSPDRVLRTPIDVQSSNVILWDFAHDVLYRRVEAEVVLLDEQTLRHNAAVIANYRQTSPTSGRFSYYLAEIDWDASINGFKLFRLAFFDGNQYSNVFAVPVPNLALEHSYLLRMTAYQNLHLSTSVWLEAELKGVTNPAIAVKIGPLAINNFGPTVGRFGLHTLRAASAFKTFCVSNSIDPLLEP